MTNVTIPQFGELLAEHLQGVPASAYPFLLSQLERSAAQRYRMWADAVPDHRDGLLDCAAREDRIAAAVEALFPPSDADRAQVMEVIPAARATYWSAFEGHDPFVQMTIQADAERQGSQAWQRLKAAFPEHAAALDELSATEVESAEYLDALLSVRS